MTTTTTTQVQQYCCQIALITLTFCYLEFSSALLPAFLLLSLFLFLLLLQRRTSEHEGGTRVCTTTTTTQNFQVQVFPFALSLVCVSYISGGAGQPSHSHTRFCDVYWTTLTHTHCVYFLCKHNNSKQKFLCCRCEFFSFIFYVNDNARVLSSALCIFILITRQLEINSSHFSPLQHFIHTLQNY